jgi:hypothetical protein
MGEGVKILDAGTKPLLSGTDAEEIRSVLHDFIRRGAKVVTPPTQLGGKWITACTPPVQSDGAVRHGRPAEHRLQVVTPARRGDAHRPMR